MSQFTTPLRVELIGKNLWKIIEGFEYHVGTYPSENVIRVPVGETTDFASVPRIFWFLISPIDNHAKAAVIHDYLYKTAMFSKKEADKIFREGLKILGVEEWKINCMYWSVKYFGWNAWNRYRKNKPIKENVDVN